MDVPCNKRDRAGVKAVFRADASLLIGTGHVMRCLTLARTLAGIGWTCEFICRRLPGNLIGELCSAGFVVHELAIGADPLIAESWLGADVQEESSVCRVLFEQLRPDWIVVDHYALDAEWERNQRPYCDRLMVIDDLADRSHECDLLLDQTHGRHSSEYDSRLPAAAMKLCGAEFALLRPEFGALRKVSLARRIQPECKNVLVNMGGTDLHNVTSAVLVALDVADLPEDARIRVVMGGGSPWVELVRDHALRSRWRTEVIVGASNMAELMVESDLAIGAAGSTSWERCCLGLPSILIVLADNQKMVAAALTEVGAAFVLEKGESMDDRLPELVSRFVHQPETHAAMSEAAARLVDGRGAHRVTERMLRMGSEGAQC